MAEKAFLTVNKTRRKIKKQCLTVGGVYRKVRKVYETANGVYVLRWAETQPAGDTVIWKKYNASRSWVNGYYVQTDYEVGNTHTNGGYFGNPVNLNLYDGYTFSQNSGFSGTTASSTGRYRTDSTHVYVVDKMEVDDNMTTADNIYVNVTYRCIASALYYSGYYTYSKGNYVTDVECAADQLPTAGTPAYTENSGNRIYVQEGGAWYCYEKA